MHSASVVEPRTSSNSPRRISETTLCSIVAPLLDRHHPSVCQPQLMYFSPTSTFMATSSGTLEPNVQFPFTVFSSLPGGSLFNSAGFPFTDVNSQVSFHGAVNLVEGSVSPVHL